MAPESRQPTPLFDYLTPYLSSCSHPLRPPMMDAIDVTLFVNRISRVITSGRVHPLPPKAFLRRMSTEKSSSRQTVMTHIQASTTPRFCTWTWMSIV
ncbi:unnamed protein product, partial [Echinostoma caproni]